MLSRYGFCWSVNLLILCVCMLLSGCGYSSEQLFPEGYRTVAVPIFENRTFYRGVEFDLSEALVKELELRSPYKVIDPCGADTILQGTITRIEQDQLSRRRAGGVPQELEVTITVDFEWRDLGSGQPICDRRGFESVGRYIPTEPVSQPFEAAQHQAVWQMARDLVSVMQSDW